MSRVTSDLRNLSAQELIHKKSSLDKELQELRQKRLTGQLDKSHLFKASRRQIARVLTILKEKAHDL